MCVSSSGPSRNERVDIFKTEIGIWSVEWFETWNAVNDVILILRLPELCAEPSPMAVGFIGSGI